MKTNKKFPLLLASLFILGGCTTPKNGGGSTDPETSQAKNQALDYINSIDLDLYRTTERSQLEDMIRDVKAILNDKESSKEDIESAIDSLKLFVSTLKTNAQYEQEEQEGELEILKERKKEALARLNKVNPSSYRKEEREDIQERLDYLKKRVNECVGVAELASIDFNEFDQFVASHKTNADYTFSEIQKYGIKSGWDLVNEHAKNWTMNKDTRTMGVTADGWLIDGSHLYQDVDISFSVNNAGQDIDICGVFLGKNNPIGNGGLDGYLINLVSKPGSQFVQVWYMEGAYVGGTLTYIDGWFYPGTVKGANLRVEYRLSQEKITVRDADAYETMGSDSESVTVDLSTQKTNSGGDLAKKFTEPMSLGFLNMDQEPNQIKINYINTVNENFSSLDVAKHYVDNYLAGLPEYRKAEQDQIDAQVASIKDHAPDYEAAMNGLEDLKELVKTLKTAKQYQDEEDAQNIDKVREARLAEFSFDDREFDEAGRAIRDQEYTKLSNALNALQTIDEVNAYDVQKHIDVALEASNAGKAMKEMINNPTSSGWPLVVEHVTNNYKYEAPNKVTLTPTDGTGGNSVIGWTLGSTDYSDFELAFEVDVAEALWANSGEQRGFLVRAKLGDNGGVSGYLINLTHANNKTAFYFQVWYLESRYGTSDKTLTYLNGWVYDKPTIYNNFFRIRFEGNKCKIWDRDVINPTDGAKVEFNLDEKAPLYTSGKIGILNWNNTEATYVMHRLMVL